MSKLNYDPRKVQVGDHLKMSYEWDKGRTSHLLRKVVAIEPNTVSQSGIMFKVSIYGKNSTYLDAAWFVKHIPFQTPKDT